MTNVILAYLDHINQYFKASNATEHTYRGELQQLIENLQHEVKATNEPKRQKCGAPDYIITQNNIPIGFIEAKDIGDDDLDGKKKAGGNKEQFDRYKASLENIIFTDYLDFHLYQNAELVAQVRIADIQKGIIKPLKDNFDQFKTIISDFCAYKGQTITSSQALAKLMADKARLLAQTICNAVVQDMESGVQSSLKAQMDAMKKILIHDIDAKEFSDVYAQTITYGLFAARLHDTSLETFTRQEAAELIPKTNPFLRSLFGYIAGPDIDERIQWIVDSLARLFLFCNVKAIMQNYGKSTKLQDPTIHFYETFLAEYDPNLRKVRGVWYTPLPVVKFIVRAVDEVLKADFGFAKGLADNSTIKKKVNVQGQKHQVEKEFHKVQILDPATGTGTFPAEVISLIHGRFKNQQGMWSSYAEKHLIPRLNGFEILMASYAMAHLKLDNVLSETGVTSSGKERFRIFLTNSLEEHHPDTGTLFASWLSNEANEANYIKRDTPVMCILGNPPYSGESQNKGEWIMRLMDDYKKEPGGKEALKERNPKWINDDYVKFIRYGQHFIEKNKLGILAYINPHGYLDNPTFRGMRWNLLKTYDKIYTIDLHGNSKKKETAPDGSVDENVFDIQQGVSINIFVKTGQKKKGELAQVFHYDLYGKREAKYEFLLNNTLQSTPFTLLQNNAPMYFMVPKDFTLQKTYNKGFSVAEIFPVNSVGIVTARDNFTIHHSKAEVKQTIKTFLALDDESARSKFNLGKDVRDWKVAYAKQDLEANLYTGQYTEISYRPFDTRWTFYTGNSKGFHCYPRKEVMQHFLSGNNIGMVLCRQFKAGDFYNHAFISDRIIESTFVSNKTSEITYAFPLYLYSIATNNQEAAETVISRLANLKKECIQAFEKSLKLPFTAEKQNNNQQTFAPIDLLDYIYAVLHSPAYREKYAEFLKVDFPRVPYPKDVKQFWQLVTLGSKIRELHLMASTALDDLLTLYPVAGDNKITINPRYENGKVWINETQYFDNVPELAWNFYIGGYQPAQKWLKDRKEQTLDFEAIEHYQKIISALTLTDQYMKEIDTVIGSLI